MRLPRWSLAWFALNVWSQPDPAALLEKARERARIAAAGLSHYACSQTVQRETYRFFPQNAGPFRESRKTGCRGTDAGVELARRDRVRLELTVDAGKELLSWPGESRTERGGARALAADGLVTTGDFAAFLTDIFRQNRIQFLRWEGAKPGTNGVYRYSVPVEESEYAMEAGRGKRARMAFGGQVWIDSQTGDPKRLTITVDKAPKGSGTCRLETAIVYGRVERDWLRPVETRVTMWEEDGTRYENRSEFAGCRRFGSESVLRAEVSAEAELGAPRATVPAGLRVRLRLRQPIQAERAAAGDVVEAEVTGAPQGAGGQTALPAGAVVRGRIVRATHHIRPTQFLVLALHFPGFAAAPKSIAKIEMATPWEREQGAGVYVIAGNALTTGSSFETEWITKPDRH